MHKNTHYYHYCFRLLLGITILARFNSANAQTCANGTLSTYTLNPATTISTNTIAVNGGSLNLVYELSSGSAVPGMGNSFTVPFTYSDMNNTATGVDNQWYGFSTLTLDGKPYFVLQPKTDNTPGGLYNGLPANNQQTEQGTTPDNTDNFFTTRIQNGNIDVLGNFTFSFGNFPAMPGGASIYEQDLTLRQTGNLTDVVVDKSGGFWEKPVDQTDVNTELNSRTPPFPASMGQSYVYRYSAFSDGTQFPSNVDNLRGAGIAGSLTICYSTLPVKLTSFQVVKEQNTPILSWKTTEESNSDKFEVQHSTDGKNWKIISTIAAKGESRSLVSYSYTDITPANGENLYRLRMVDKDGTSALSRIVSISLDKQLTVLLYPNPASTTIKLEIANWGDMKEVKIYDLNGKKVFFSNKLTSNEINVGQLAAGTYILSVTDKNGETHRTNFLLSK